MVFRLNSLAIFVLLLVALIACVESGNPSGGWGGSSGAGWSSSPDGSFGGSSGSGWGANLASNDNKKMRFTGYISSQ
ncbi:unnamed protein product [Anisakis simplex]|uniref:Uncharacterized protein n=1 Tax=Anisakis simplex TaxID=6269 RepID=A0A0M3KI46_ANISI|nr:unnamed protein product [Anisakis simplex]